MRHFTINQATTPTETRTILRTAFASGHVVSGIRTADADDMQGLEKRGLAGLRRMPRGSRLSANGRNGIRSVLPQVCR